MSESSTSADAQAICGGHIFGEADPETKPLVAPVPEESDRPRGHAPTNLSLKGTIAAIPDDKSVAIIADGRDEEKIYSIGESVAAGAKLHAVYADRVVLNENGVLTNLKLPKDFPEGTAPVTRREYDRRPSRRRRRYTESFRPSSRKMCRKLADVIRPTPYFVDGQQQGYRVYPGPRPQAVCGTGVATRRPDQGHRRRSTERPDSRPCKFFSLSAAQIRFR